MNDTRQENKDPGMVPGVSRVLQCGKSYCMEIPGRMARADSREAYKPLSEPVVESTAHDTPLTSRRFRLVFWMR